MLTEVEMLIAKIIYSMINQNKSQKYIITTLKELDIYEHTAKSLNESTKIYLLYKWDNLNDEWIQTNENTFFADDFYSRLNHSVDTNINSNVSKALSKKFICIPTGANIPKLETMELACTVLKEGEKISVSANDAETLLKNMAAIQSKLNEIVGVLNKISVALSFDKP